MTSRGLIVGGLSSHGFFLRSRIGPVIRNFVPSGELRTRFVVLGVYVTGRTREKQTAVTGEDSQSVGLSAVP